MRRSLLPESIEEWSDATLFDRGCLVIEEGCLKAYLPVADDEHDGGEIQEYSSFNQGHTWTLTDHVTHLSEYSHNYAVRVRNAHLELQVMWSYGDSSPTGTENHEEASELMLHGVDGTLGTLDYGSAYAYVLLPELRGDASIFMYYGNPEAPDISSFPMTMQTSYVRLPAGSSDDDLLIEWLMEEGEGTKTTDQRGYGNDGIGVLDGDDWVSDGSNYERRYDISYPGTVIDLEHSDFVHIPEVAGPEEIDELTLELWFRTDESVLHPLVTLDPSEELLRLDFLSGTLRFYTRPEALVGGGFVTPSIAEGKWHHVAAVYDGVNMLLYLDGMRASTFYEQSGPVSWAGHPLFLGTRGGAYFYGRVDEFRLSARALSEDEIRAHYHKVMNADVEVEIGVQPSAVADFISGRLVRRLVGDQVLAPGHYSTVWDGRNDTGAPVAGGVYLCRVTAGPLTGFRRLVVLR